MQKVFRRVGFVVSIATLVLASALFSMPQAVTRAADHADAPLADHDRPTDIGDLYAFLDPADNTKVVFVFTVVGFIVPCESVNQAGFDSNVRYRLELEETGDAVPDRFIDVTFSQQTSRAAAQTATIVLPNGVRLTAPTTVQTLASTPPARVVTTDGATGVSFYAGVADDPFFFDIAGFGRFVSSILAGSPDVSQLERGRDSFAGYNTQAVAISVPLSMLRTSNGIIGVDLLTQRQVNRKFKANTGVIRYSGKFANVDRAGIPTLNTVLIPFGRKDEYNRSSTTDDAGGVFASDIIATLTALGTNADNIGILASVAVLNGDYLRLNTTIPNTGTGGGDNAEAGFPNGRRLKDDVIDGVPANDVPFTDAFPYLGLSQQPRAAGTMDDNTRN